jgi:uncharacterized protein YcnI
MGLLWVAAPASAHVTITPSTTAAGASAVLQVGFQHGCDGSSTTALTIRIPEGINSVAPTLVAGWQVDKEVEALDPAVTDSHGVELTERVASVTYGADEPVRDGYRQVFELAVQLPEAEGETLAFPTIQTCEAGEAAWIDVAGDGASADELESPAPTLTLTAATGEEEHAHGAADEAEGADEAEAAAQTAPAAATPADTGTDPLAIVALAAGLVGVALGGTALALQRRRA